MLLQNTYRTILTMTAACLVLGGCDDDDGVSPEDQAIVRFVNAMTGPSNDLTLRANGTLLESDIDYQTAGDCRGLVPDNVDFTVTGSGSSTVLASLPNQNLTAGTRYTLVASGSTLAPALTLLTDTYTSPGNNRARLRVINTVGASSPFDVYIGTPGSALGIANDGNVGFNMSRSYIDVPSGTTQVRVTTPNTQTVLGTSTNFSLNEGNVRTVFFTPATTVGGAFTSFAVSTCSL